MALVIKLYLRGKGAIARTTFCNSKLLQSFRCTVSLFDGDFYCQISDWNRFVKWQHCEIIPPVFQLFSLSCRAISLVTIERARAKNNGRESCNDTAAVHLVQTGSVSSTVSQKNKKVDLD
jgi:hypothetical protein